MIDIWGHGSIGSLIKMVHNIYYGTRYNISTLIEPKFEMNSYSTQVAQLQFGYIYEVDKICLVGQGMGQGFMKHRVTQLTHLLIE
jgi:hypothetical protein